MAIELAINYFGSVKKVEGPLLAENSLSLPHTLRELYQSYQFLDAAVRTILDQLYSRSNQLYLLQSAVRLSSLLQLSGPTQIQEWISVA